MKTLTGLLKPAETCALRANDRAHRIGWICLISICLLTISSASSQTITVSFPDTAGMRGDTVEIPLYATSIRSSDSVLSGLFGITYNNSFVKILGIDQTGTLLQSASSVLFSPTTNNLAFALTSPLVGSGVLVKFRVEILVNSSSSSTQLGFSQAYFNEGSPGLSAGSGSVRAFAISVAPAYPSSIAVGDSLQFSVTGDVLPPVKWATSDTAIARIDTTGKLLGVAPGHVRVVVTDNRGLKDSTNLFQIYPLQFNSLTVSTPDTSQYQTLLFDLPVRVSDVTGLGVTSAAISLAYNESILHAVSVLASGMLPSSWAPPTSEILSGDVNVALAGSQPLSGSVVLFYVRFVVQPGASYTTRVTPSNVLFNESLTANDVGGLFTPILAPSIAVSSGEASFIVGDTSTFSATGGIGPYWYSVDQPTLALVDSISGLFTALRHGITRVIAHDSRGFSGSDSVHLYDFRFSIPSNVVYVGDSISVPITTAQSLTGKNVVSFIAHIAYDTSFIHFVQLATNGTLSQSYTNVANDMNGTITIASAGLSPLTGSGQLMRMLFRSTPAARRNMIDHLNFEDLSIDEPSALTPLALTNGGNLTFGNRAPVFVKFLPDTTLHSGVNLSFTYRAVDPDSDTVRYHLLSSPAGVVIDTTTGLLTWRPAQQGTFKVIVSASDGELSVVDTSTISVFGAVLQLSEKTLALGSIKLGQHIDTTVAVTNNGNDTLRITAITSSNPQFIERPTSLSVLPGRALSDTLRFAPNVLGPSSAFVVFTSNSSSSPDTVVMSGYGSGTPLVNLSATSISFGTVPIGKFKDTTVTITNAGNDTLKITSITSSHPSFSARPTMGSAASGQHFIDTLRFSPSAIGPASATLILVSNSTTSPDTIRVSGISAGVPGISFSEIGISFGAVKVNAYADSVITMTNTGYDTLRVFSTHVGTTTFSSQLVNAIIPQGQSATDTIRFTPSTFGVFADSLTVSTNIGVAYLSLSGSSPYPSISVFPDSVRFGNVGKNDTAPASIWVLNNSVNTLVLDSMYTASSAFRASITKASVPYQDTISITILFMPGNNASYFDTLFIHGNSLISLTKVSLSGNGTLTSVPIPLSGIPSKYALEQNYPNPFNPSTNISFSLPKQSNVRLSIIDLLGREVATLVDNEERSAGNYTVMWNASSFASGVYFYRLQAGDFVQTKKLVLLK